MWWSVFRWVSGIVGAIVVIGGIGLWAFLKFNPHLLALVIPPGLPDRDEVDRVVWLDQNWSEHDRFWFHHVSQGTATIAMPYNWFVSMEAPEITLFSNPPLLRDAAYLARMGFISSPTGWAHDSFGYRRDKLKDHKDSTYRWTKFPGNNAGLPVGLSRMKGKTHPETGEIIDNVGFNCAACHTGQFNYKGTNVRIDGAPATVDLGKFRSAMKVALVLTANYPGRFDRFAKRLAAREAEDGNTSALEDFGKFEAKLRDDLNKAFKRVKREGKLLEDIAKARCKKQEKSRCNDMEEGFGRLDALNRIGNQVFFKNQLESDHIGDKNDAHQAAIEAIKPNNAAISAPVSFPHIWSTPWFLWAQYDASIMQPLVRNGGEALGVSAHINLKSPGKKNLPLFGSTVDFEELIAIENLLQGKDPFKVPPEKVKVDGNVKEVRSFQGLKAPKWPAHLFPSDGAWKVDKYKAAQGEKLYQELCVNCHLPPVSDPKFWSSKAWKDLKKLGTKYLLGPEFKQDFIGTDSSQAEIVFSRQVFVPKHLGIEPAALLESCGIDPGKIGVKPGVQTQMPFALALMAVTGKTVEAWMDRTQMSEEERKRIWGVRENCPHSKLIRALRQKPLSVGNYIYRARPLDGVWATAPFLHNGSIPTLWDLLSPLDERPKIFCLGSREFDPTKVGYDTKCGERKWSQAWDFRRRTTRIDVSTPGNRNSGHRFEDGQIGKGVIGRKLSEDERWALIEYLKTL